MSNPIIVGYSPLSGKIYAGRGKPQKNGELRIFTGDKFDVTEDAVSQVARKLMNEEISAEWQLDDGSVLTLTATLTPAQTVKP